MAQAEPKYLLCYEWGAQIHVVCFKGVCALCAGELAIDVGNRVLVDRGEFMPVCVPCGLPMLLAGTFGGTLIGGELHGPQTPIGELLIKANLAVRKN